MNRFLAFVPPPVLAAVALSVIGGVVPAPLVRGAPEPPPPAAPAGEEPATAPTESKPLNLNLPLVIGEPATGVRIPQYGDLGQLLSLLNSMSIKRLDESRLELQGTELDLNKPDGKTDFRIRLPKAIFDTRTRVLTSLEPVSVSTADFELQGERMEFDTGARRGRLTGWVYMKIFATGGKLGSGEGGGDDVDPKAGATPASSP